MTGLQLGETKVIFNSGHAKKLVKSVPAAIQVSTDVPKPTQKCDNGSDRMISVPIDDTISNVNKNH